MPLETYSSLGALLKGLRRFHGMTQAEAAEKMEVPSRTWRRWEGGALVNQDHRRMLAESHLIPLEVVERLSSGMTVLFNLRTRRFAYNTFETDFINKKIVREELHDDASLSRISAISEDRDIPLIHDYDALIYPTENALKASIITSAQNAVPELNFVINDNLGLYAGHVVCLPLSDDVHEGLRSGDLEEGDLSTWDVAPKRPWKDPPCLHFYSIYAACSGFAYTLLKGLQNGIRTLVVEGQISKNSVVSGYAVTDDGIELCQKIGLSLVFESPEEQEKLGTEKVPSFYQGTVGDVLLPI